MECPKCASKARDTARFCPRCHATLRYECPACFHQQVHGGSCDKCGVDFLKYLSAVVVAKKAEADLIHDRIERRSSLLTNLLYTPFTLGIPLIRDLLVGSRKSRS
jgi:zinc-ribbon domain